MHSHVAPSGRAEHPDRPVAGRRALLRLSAALLGAAVAGQLKAQAYPSRAVRIVVPWAPGGLVDTAGRTLGDALSRSLGQPVSVENIAGAAGTLGADQVAKARPDGHTLLTGTSSIAIDLAGARKTPYDPLRDLVPVALVADTDSLVVVAASSPIRTLAELVAAARARELTYGTPGIGSPAHLFSELFAQTARVKLLHVPYGRTQALTDLMGGRLDFMIATTPSSLPQVRNGQLRPLAITSGRRSPQLPAVPTVAEAGLPGYEATQWVGLFAPAGTPPEVVARLNAEVNKALAVPELAQSLQQRGLEPRTGTPDDFARVLAAEVQKWTRVIRAASIHIE